VLLALDDHAASRTRGLPRTRTLPVNLAPVTDGEQQPATRIWKEFEELHPQLLTIFADTLSTALRRFTDTELGSVPRLADTACWAVAAAPALGLTPAQVLGALEEDSTAPALAGALLAFMRERSTWAGTSTALIALLPKDVAPASPKALTQELNRLAPALRSEGLSLEYKRTQSARLWTIRWIAAPDSSPPAGFGPE